MVSACLASITKTFGINMAATLEKVRRPLVEFDVNNVEHRQFYFSFIKNNSWGNCPYRFSVKGYGNIKGGIDSKMLIYYVCNEFDKLSNHENF
jgi:hypothetical protein